MMFTAYRKLLLVGLLQYVPFVMPCMTQAEKDEIIEGKKTLFSFVAASDLLALENPLERSDWEDGMFVNWELKPDSIDAFKEELGLPEDVQIANVSIVKDEEKKPYLSMMTKRVSLVDHPDTVQVDWMLYVTTPDQEVPTLMVIDSLYDFRARSPVGFTRASRRLTYDVQDDKIALGSNKRDERALRVALDLTKMEDGSFDPSFARSFDKLYWPNLVYSRLFSNGSLSRAKVKVAKAAGEDDAAASAFDITGDLPWADYIQPNPSHVTYVPNTIQLGSEVWVNADEESRLLVRERDNIYKERARTQLSAVGDGESEPSVKFTIGDSSPSYFINYKITDLEGIAAEIPLPDGFELSKIRFREHGEEDYFLTLNVYGVEGLETGLRAEWSVFVKEEGAEYPNFMMVQITSNNMSPVPVDFKMSMPFKPAASAFTNQVRNGNVVTDIRVANLQEQYSFSVSFPDPGAEHHHLDKADLALLAANDRIFYLSGINDVGLWDARVADMTFAVVDPLAVEVRDRTKWTEFVESDPHEVLIFYQEGDYILSPWNNAEEIKTCSD